MSKKVNIDHYKTLLQNDENAFLDKLDQFIAEGKERKELVKELLKLITPPLVADPVDFLLKRRKNGDLLIHNVAKFHDKTDVLGDLIQRCPDLIPGQRIKRYEGQTALHIYIIKGNIKAIRMILKRLTKENELLSLFAIKAKGPIFEKTVMLGELALSVAALALQFEIVDLLIENKANICQQNSRGDTVFHSLVRFASLHHEKREKIIKMIVHINDSLKYENTEKQEEVADNPDLISEVWYKAENKDRYTALKLAAKLGEIEVFRSILKLENVYCRRNATDGLNDLYLFDITEIDTITQAEWERNMKLNETKQHKYYEKDKDSIDQKVDDTNQTEEKQHKPALRHDSPAVLEILFTTTTATSFELLDVDVVKQTIERKWNHYKKNVFFWFLYHTIMMVIITTYAIKKTKVINSRIYDNSEASGEIEDFVLFASILSPLFAIIYIVLECVRTFCFWKDIRQFPCFILRHSGFYRLLLFVMSVALMLDSLWFWIKPNNNYFLILALICGWTFMNFFLRAVRCTSFFTIMFIEIIFTDLPRIFLIIAFQIIAFTVTMHITFLNSDPVPSDFDDFGKTLLTMFNLMIGLDGIDVLHSARNPWLAITLFVVFSVITYLVLINALIALMSQTCARLSLDRKKQCTLQKLSVALLLETMLPPCCRYLKKPEMTRYNMHSLRKELRSHLEIAAPQTGSSVNENEKKSRSKGRKKGGESDKDKTERKIRLVVPQPQLVNNTELTEGTEAMQTQNCPSIYTIEFDST